MKSKKPAIIVFFILLAFDQLTKILFLNRHFSAFLFDVNFTKNTGISFGMLQGSNGIIVGVSVAVLALLYFFRKEFKNYIFLSLIIVGIIGNLIDRVLRGYVIDFIDFGWWPVFNVADSCLTVGVAGFIIYTIFFEAKKREEK